MPQHFHPALCAKDLLWNADDEGFLLGGYVRCPDDDDIPMGGSSSEGVVSVGIRDSAVWVECGDCGEGIERVPGASFQGRVRSGARQERLTWALYIARHPSKRIEVFGQSATFSICEKNGAEVRI